MDLIKFLRENGSPFNWKLNLFKIKTVHLSPTPEDAHFFNQIIDYIFWCDESWDIIQRAKKGGVSIKLDKLLPPMWDIEVGDTSLVLTLIHEEGCARVTFQGDFNGKKKRYPISGKQALYRFNKKCLKYGVDMNSYIVPPEEALKIKEQMPKYLVQVLDGAECGIDAIYENCHHIDFHSSFPAGLANTHPEFRPPVQELYDNRKKNQIEKCTLNLSIGMMQSIKWDDNAQHIALAYDAVKDNNERVLALTETLAANGRKPLLHNTDGVWYQGEIYHGEGEGKNLGEWENDHINCTFRMKSAGAYEYVENNKYQPVIRGYTNWDKQKDREEWEWGDIFRDEAAPYVFCWNDTYITDDKGEIY